MSTSDVEMREIIERIRNNEMTETELIECLDIKQLYVLSNTISKILALRITNDDAIPKLENISQYIGERYCFWENISIGHFAIAAMYLLNTDNSLSRYKEIYDQSDADKQAKIGKAIIILKDIVKSKSVSYTE